MIKFLKKIRVYIFNKRNKTKISSHRASLSAKYGVNVLIGSNTYVENNVSIGDYSYINSNSYIENCSVGKYCSISSGVYISPFEHNYKFKSTHPILFNKKQGFIDEDLKTTRKPVIIGNDVLISLNAIIKEGINIGNGAVIGAGAFVTKDVKPYEIVGGVPAKHIKFRFSQEEINYLENLSWWDWDDEKIRQNIKFLRNETDSLTN